MESFFHELAYFIDDVVSLVVNVWDSWGSTQDIVGCFDCNGLVALVLAAVTPLTL